MACARASGNFVLVSSSRLALTMREMHRRVFPRTISVGNEGLKSRSSVSKLSIAATSTTLIALSSFLASSRCFRLYIFLIDFGRLVILLHPACRVQRASRLHRLSGRAVRALLRRPRKESSVFPGIGGISGRLESWLWSRTRVCRDEMQKSAVGRLFKELNPSLNVLIFVSLSISLGNSEILLQVRSRCWRLRTCSTGVGSSVMRWNGMRMVRRFLNFVRSLPIL
mmetsp:Transcript_18093/g.36498  ORF Transcript_18093/g.36498 Transcript_18093/m.36498 type:complete len:225 (+) Transcript_18093:312-986(+)